LPADPQQNTVKFSAANRQKTHAFSAAQALILRNLKSCRRSNVPQNHLQAAQQNTIILNVYQNFLYKTTAQD